MRILLALCVSVLVISSCEDTKKNKSVKTENTPIKVTERTPQPPDPVKKTNQDSFLPDGFEKITQDNVVSFFTEYGKKHQETKVKLSTRLGDIYLSLYEDTPLHRANFIFLVKQGYFSDTFFHRAVPNFIIQGGNSDLHSTNKKRAKIGATYLLPAEINDRKHTYGSVSGAKEYRENPDKKTMPFEFFIFLGPQSSTSHLNGNYTVFGKVTQGMDVVEKIAKLETDEGEWPLQNVYIKAEVVN